MQVDAAVEAAREAAHPAEAVRSSTRLGEVNELGDGCGARRGEGNIEVAVTGDYSPDLAKRSPAAGWIMATV